jgi:hypothetical protein
MKPIFRLWLLIEGMTAADGQVPDLLWTRWLDISDREISVRQWSYG